MSITDNTIMGFCIFQYINSGSSDFRGYIEDKIKVIDNGKESFRCNIENDIFRKWNFLSSFYALSPSFRPIPYNMIMIAIEYTNYQPRRIINIYVNNDIFEYKDNTIYFLCYNQKLPNTLPLYFYSYGGSIVPTFEDKPLTTDPNWKPWNIPVIYVLKTKINKFTCYEGNIIPDNSSNKTFYENLMLCKSETFFDEIEKIKKSQSKKSIKNKTFSRITSTSCNSKIILGICFALIVCIFITIGICYYKTYGSSS